MQIAEAKVPLIPWAKSEALCREMDSIDDGFIFKRLLRRERSVGGSSALSGGSGGGVQSPGEVAIAEPQQLPAPDGDDSDSSSASAADKSDAGKR